MTIYDAAMAIVVVAGMVRGAWMGITWQLASIASLVLGYVVSHQASAQFAPYFPGEPEVARTLAMGVIYVVVSAGVYGAARLIRGILHKLKFEAYDRHLGMLLGGGEAVFVGMVLTMFVVSLAPATRQPVFSSPTGKMVGTVMNSVGPVLPEEVRKVLAPIWEGTPSALAAVDGATAEAPAGAKTADHGAKPDPADSPALPPLHEVPATSHASAPSLPALPPLEAPPGNDRSVQRASAPSLDGLIEQGRQAVEQAVAGSLDTDPAQKATSLRQLADKDRKRIQNAVGSSLNKGKQVGNQVKQRVTKGKQNIEQSISDSISRGQQKVEQAITDSIDEQIRRLGGLESAPQAGPK
jgi:membrane protein required for colicin V production